MPPPTVDPSAAATPTGPADDRANSKGSFRLGRVAGTDVFVHWSWFVAAYFLYRGDAAEGTPPAWAAAEYVAGFAVVLLHEFGHVLACRQVGGRADRVVLWPLGGLAFVNPPPRPGAMLWTTAAGPLVNVLLAPALFALAWATAPDGEDPASGLSGFLAGLSLFNVGILVFNLLPIYPLDGGRLLHAVLWWCFGPAVGLAIAAAIGLLAGAGLGVLAVSLGEWWLAVMAGFLTLGAFQGLQQARLIRRLTRAARELDPGPA